MDNVFQMSIETEEELEGLRQAGHVVAVVLRELRRRVQPGVTTGEPDGFYADACVTVPVGPVPARSARLMRAADAALRAGLVVGPNTPSDDPARLRAGLVITIEPILGAGGPGIRLGDDGWTISTADGAVAAHVEHTIVVTDGAPLVLTR